MKKTVLLPLRLVLLFLLPVLPGQNHAYGQNWLNANGNKLYDAQGKEVRLTGINWFGFETAQLKFHGLWTRDMKSVLKQIKDLGFNCIRIPYTDAMLKPGAAIQIDSYGSDPYTGVTPMNGDIAHVKTPLALLDEVVKWCQANHLKIILDNHARIPDGYLAETIWYSAEVPEATWIDNWVFLANRYKTYDAVVGMDLDNEPHGKTPGSPTTATWGNSSPGTDWNKAAERCGNAILQANPNVLILVEGIELVNNEPYWWGGNLLGVRNYPVKLSNPAKLMYSPHEYGPTVHPQPWFTDPAFPANLPGIWDKFFGYIYNQGISPLLVGEFGIKTPGGADEVWFKNFLAYMGTRYSWTFWCFNPNSGDTGGIVGDDWVTTVKWKHDLLKPYLAPMIPNGTVTTPVNQAPVANAGPDKTVTLPASSVTLAGSATDADGTIMAYAWSQVSGPNAATLSGAATASLSAGGLAAGTYVFRLTVTDNGGLKGTDDASVVVSATTANRAPVAGFTAAPVSGPAPLAVSFDASASSDPDGGVLAFSWNFGDGTTGTGKTVSHTYPAGSFTATLTVTDGKGGSNAATKAIAASGTTAPSSLKVQYRNGDASATDNAVKPHFQIVNAGNTAVPLSELKIRYWYTREGSAGESFWCDYANLGSSNVTGRFVTLPAPVASANGYLEVGFSTTAGPVAAGGNSGEIQARFSKNDWSSYTETGDYSYDPTKTAYADWSRVTLYRNGVLVWGTEPTGLARLGTGSEAASLRTLPFPNPATERVTLRLPERWMQHGRIIVMTANGQVVQTITPAGAEHTLDLSRLKPGVYFIRVAGSSGQQVYKVVKQ